MTKFTSHSLFALGCAAFLNACTLLSSISKRTEVIHALSDQDQLPSPLSGQLITVNTDITFPRNRYLLTNAQKLRLMKMAVELKESKKPLIIAGFSSVGGLPEYSRILSQRRAEEVRAVLIEAGLEPANLHSTGFGNDIRSQPSNDIVRLYTNP